MSKKLNIQGQRFSRWTVLDKESITIRNHTKVWCRCDCGTEKLIDDQSLKTGRSTSCGCYHKSMTNAMQTHGDSSKNIKATEYNSWAGMKQRCYNKNNIRYPEWGGKGVTVCDRWLNSYEAFLEDVGRKPAPHYTLDRYPNKTGNYEPNNVRWATPKQQSNNTARNRNIEHDGEVRTLAQWADKYKIQPATLSSRLRHNWDLKEALNTPVSYLNRNFKH